MTSDFYDDPQVFATYTQHRHSGVSSPHHVMEEPALWRHLGSVVGDRVADLGCGDAAIGPALLDAGCASYYGADASVAMVTAADRRLRDRAARSERTADEEQADGQPGPGQAGDGQPRDGQPRDGQPRDGRARVEHARIEDFSFPANTFDLIISRLALHYLDDVASVLRACAACLSPGGRLVFTVLHPVITSHDGRVDPSGASVSGASASGSSASGSSASRTSASGTSSSGASASGGRTSWLVDDYFSRGPRDRAWMGGTVRWQHRTIEDYVTALVGAGFAVQALSECPPERSRFDGHGDEFARRLRTPLFLLLSARLPG